VYLLLLCTTKTICKDAMCYRDLIIMNSFSLVQTTTALSLAPTTGNDYVCLSVTGTLVNLTGLACSSFKLFILSIDAGTGGSAFVL